MSGALSGRRIGVLGGRGSATWRPSSLATGVERLLRLKVELLPAARARFRTACVDAKEEPLAALVDDLATALGPGPHRDFSVFLQALDQAAERQDLKLTAKRLRLLQAGLAERDEEAAPVIRRTHKVGKAAADPIRGRFEADVGGRRCVMEYEPDPDHRDTATELRRVRREVSPHLPWRRGP